MAYAITLFVALGFAIWLLNSPQKEHQEAKVSQRLSQSTIKVLSLVGGVAIIFAIARSTTSDAPSNVSSKGSYTSSYSSSKGYSDSSRSNYSSNSYSNSSYSNKSSTNSSSGTCKYKVGDTYVCNKKATNGSYCKEHYDYLMDAYKSITGK